MADLTEKERKRILAQVLVKFDAAYGKGLSENPDKIQTWFHQIGHLDRETALATADAAIAYHKWQPTISEYLEISRSVRRHQEDQRREAPQPLSDHIKALQVKGLAVQRALIKARTMPGRRHDHTSGHEACPICAQACSEESPDECRTCMILEDHGFVAQHNKA